MLTLLALLSTQAMAIPCAAHVEGEQILLADPIAFTPRTAELTPESTGPVQGIACLLDEQPELTVQIEVHTDARGSGAYNLRASQERAETLRTALLDKGITAERITAVGRGETIPVEHEDWAQSQALSRRIELWTDPGGRPEAPVIEPPAPQEPMDEPVIVPRPPPGFCDILASSTSATPSLPGAASCQAVGSGWLCRFGEPSATLAGRVQGCIGGARDGDELYVTRGAGRLSVTPDREGASGSLLRYEPVE